MDKHIEQYPTHRASFSIYDAIEWCNDCEWMASTPVEAEIDLWVAQELFKDEVNAFLDPTEGYFDWAREHNVFGFERMIEG